MGKGRERLAKAPSATVVWWYINSCPIPRDYDPRCVRQSIESALNKSCGFSFGVEEEVTIFAIGNLIPLTPDDSEVLYSSGIIMMHTDFSGLGRIFRNMLSWLDHNPHPAMGMLISDDPHAFFLVHSLKDEGRSNSVIPAYPPEDGTCSAAWRWKTILEESPLLKTPSQMLDHKCAGEPRWICTLCNFKTDNYEDFAQDLFGDAHDELLFSYTHFPPTEIDIFLRFRDDKDRMLDMLELEQDRLASEHPDKDDAQSEVRDVLDLEQDCLSSEFAEKDAQSEENRKQPLKAEKETNNLKQLDLTID